MAQAQEDYQVAINSPLPAGEGQGVRDAQAQADFTAAQAEANQGRDHAVFRDAALGVCGSLFPAQSLSAIGTYWGCAGIGLQTGGRGRSRFRGIFPALEHASHGGRAQVRALVG